MMGIQYIELINEGKKVFTCYSWFFDVGVVASFFALNTFFDFKILF